MLANGVQLDFGTPRETVVRMAHDRLAAAESVKVAIFTQAALMIHGAVAALGEGSSGDAAAKLKEMVSTFNDLMSPARVVEREEAVDEAKARLDAEDGKAYRVTRLPGEGGGSPAAQARGGLLRGRRRPEGA